MIPPLAALFSWPFVSAVLFNKQSVPYAIAITIVGGYLLLPTVVYFNLPLLPVLDKHSIPAISAFVLALAIGGIAMGRPGILPRNPVALVLLAMFVLGGFFTTLTNTDPIQIGSRTLAGLRVYDSFSEVLGAMITVLPFLLARKYLATSEGHRVLLTVFAVAALAYAPLTWIELRMSPQMNNWVYGFFPHSWVQHIRGGGYRPLVFLEHGLRLSIFLSAAVLATIGLFRVFPARRGQIAVGLVILGLTLLASKSSGALMITVALAPIALLLNTRTQLLVASAIGLMVLIYPAARAAGWIPVDRIEETVAQYSEERAGSLGTRLRNEEILLDRASERPIFGWGGWGRSRVYDDEGRDISITDGYWVIAFGVGGWVRYIAEFGLFVLPMVFLVLRTRKYGVGLETAVLALMLAGNLVDMIPNSSVTPLTWLLAGAVWGRVEAAATEDQNAVPDPTQAQTGRRATRPRDPVSDETAPGLRYTRQTERKERRTKPS